MTERVCESCRKPLVPYAGPGRPVAYHPECFMARRREYDRRRNADKCRLRRERLRRQGPAGVRLDRDRTAKADWAERARIAAAERATAHMVETIDRWDEDEEW